MELDVISSSSSEDEIERRLKPVSLQEGLVFLGDGEVVDNFDAAGLTASTSATQPRGKHKSTSKKLRDLKRIEKHKEKCQAASQRTGLQPDAATQNEQLPAIDSITEFPANEHQQPQMQPEWTLQKLHLHSDYATQSEADCAEACWSFDKMKIAEVTETQMKANKAMQPTGVATTSFKKQLQLQPGPSGLSYDNQASEAQSLYGGATDILVLENNASGSSTQNYMLCNQEDKVSSLLWTSANSNVENQNVTTENETVIKKDAECQTVSTGDIILLNLFTGSDIGFMKIEEVQEYLGMLHG